MHNFEIELLLANITGKGPEFIMAHPEFRLSKAQAKRFEAALDELERGIPLAYVLGHRWFFGNKFFVSKDVLIPRPETETLVELAIERAKENKPDIVADIGTGSGAIIVSLAKNIKTKFFATDISAKALTVAKKNARSLGAKVIFKRGNLAGPILPVLKDNKVLITANLPYLSAKQLREPSIKYEPKLALYGGKQAHGKIEQLIKQLARTNFETATVLLEIDPSQVNTVKKLTKKYLEDYQDIVVHKDLSGRDRIVEIIF